MARKPEARHAHFLLQSQRFRLVCSQARSLLVVAALSSAPHAQRGAEEGWVGWEAGAQFICSLVEAPEQSSGVGDMGGRGRLELLIQVRSQRGDFGFHHLQGKKCRCAHMFCLHRLILSLPYTCTSQGHSQIAKGRPSEAQHAVLTIHGLCASVSPNGDHAL